MFLVSKYNLLKQVEMLLRIAKHAADPDLAASFVQRAVDLKEQADQLADVSPYPPDVEK